MRTKALAALFVLASSIFGGASAYADIFNEGNAGNVQEGDNDNDTDQSGSASSGDAVVGQVGGVVSSGDTSVDATNRTQDSEAGSGDVEGTNLVNSVTGNNFGATCPLAADIGAAQCPLADVANTGSAANVHEGDNSTAASQAATAVSGDAVAGQVFGVVTSGSADLVLANTTLDTDATSGDADFDNVALIETENKALEPGCCNIPGVDLLATTASADLAI
jgi:hypothetical protein